MSGMYLSKDCQLIESNDADFVIFLGDNCITIKGCTAGGIVTLSCTSKTTLDDAISCLSDVSKEKVKWVCPEYPIFEGIVDMKTRILIAVIIGCDVCPGGVKGIGPQKVDEKIKQIQSSRSSDMPTVPMYDELLKWAVEIQGSKPQYNEDIITTLVYAVLYEPTNKLPMDGELVSRTYMLDEPTYLPKYLEEFKSKDTAIGAGPKILQCKGACSESSHNFLAAITHYTCPVCKEIVCKLCSGTVDTESENGKKKKSVPHCLPCRLMESLLPGAHLDINAKTVSEMRGELKRDFLFDAEKLTVDGVENAYESHSLHRELDALGDSVDFPKYPASAIKSGEHWDVIGEIDFSFGGAFLLDDKLDDRHLPGILELFASFVKFGSEDKKHTDWKRDGDVYKAVPEMFINISNKCRVDLGYRLLRRCLRHALDSRTESLDNKKAKLILYKGQVGIQIDTPMPASMKGDVYDGTTVLTKDELLACDCDCKCGSGSKKAKKSSACVHSMPRPLLLSTLLSEDLAQHMLLELTSKVTSVDVEDKYSSNEVSSMKTDVLILMEASGESALAKQVSKSTSLYDMLQSYQTGTQKTKEWNRVHKPPTKDEIGPIYDIIFESPEQKAKVLFNRSSKKANLDPTDEIVKFTPDYVRVGQVMNAAGFYPSESKFIGFKLVEWRRKRQAVDLDNVDRQRRQIESEWKSFLADSNKRSTRRTTSQYANLTQRSGRASPSTAPVTPSPRKTRSQTEAELDEPPVKKKKNRINSDAGGASNVCAKCGTKSGKGVSFHRIPPYPSEPPADASKDKLITYAAKVEMRREAADRAGKGRDCREEGLRVCNKHPFETIKRTISVTYQGSTYCQRINLTVVTGTGDGSNLNQSETTKGRGWDRYKFNQMNHLQNESQKASSPTTLPPQNETELERERRLRMEAEANAAAANLAVQQVVECHSVDDPQSPAKINPSVAKAAGFVASNESPSHTPNQQKRKFQYERVGKPYKKTATGSTSVKQYNMSARGDPKVLPTIRASEVKRRTGFNSVTTMMAYVIVVCNGDFKRIRSRCTPLTDFEEWFLYFEWKYHHTNIRSIDMEAAWGIDKRYINKIIDCKAALDMAVLLSWPRFVSFEEDLGLRKKVKWRDYDKYRCIMWDMTNIKAVAFTDASLQRSTWSDYYGMNCIKFAVFLHLSGWGGNEDCWVGGVSDTDYNKNAGYLKEQEEFAKADLVNNKLIPFHNILDRGYRGNMAAWQSGGQVALQPPSAKSDVRFSGKQTIYAGKIARDRSGNERGVGVCKRTGLVKHGFRQGTSAKRFNYGIRTWGFQANFMYEPTL